MKAKVKVKAVHTRKKIEKEKVEKISKQKKV